MLHKRFTTVFALILGIIVGFVLSTAVVQAADGRNQKFLQDDPGVLSHNCGNDPTAVPGDEDAGKPKPSATPTMLPTPTLVTVTKTAIPELDCGQNPGNPKCVGNSHAPKFQNEPGLGVVGNSDTNDHSKPTAMPKATKAPKGGK